VSRTAKGLLLAWLLATAAADRALAQATDARPDPPGHRRILRYRGARVAAEKPVRAENKVEVFALARKTRNRADLKARSERVALRPVRLKDGKTYRALLLDGWHRHTRTIGEPELPEYTSTIRIPAGSRVKVRVDAVQWVALPDEVEVAPVQMPDPDLTGFPDDSQPFARNEAVYARDSFGDKPVIELIEQVTVRGREYAVVVYRPLSYNPARKRLRAAADVDWHMELQLPVRPKRSRRDPRRGRLPQILDIRADADADEPAAGETEPAPDEQAPGSAPGTAAPDDADYLMIAHDNFVEEIGPLADWWHRKGLKTYIAGYPSETGSGEAAVSNYIHAAYAAGTMLSFVLIVGDHENVPACQVIGHPYHGSTHTWYTDLHYALVDGNDTRPDLALGRLACDTEAQVTTAVNKILDYDRNPAPGAWLKEMLGAAQNQSGRWFDQDVHRVGDFMGPDYDFYGDWNGYDTTDDPFNKGYTVHFAVNSYPASYYAGYYPLRITPPDPVPDAWTAHGTGGRSIITPWLNDGVGFVLHRDHGSTGGWGTPAYNISDVNGLVNGNRLPLVVSINCLTGRFDGGDYFCEAWLRNPNGGGVAALGHMRVSYSGENDTLHVGVMDAIWEDYSTWSSSTYPASRRLGELNNYARDAVGYSGYYELLTARMFHLLGDPALEFRSEFPATLHATHPVSLPPNQAAGFSVHVTRNGTNCAGATVALVLDPTEYHVAVTDNSGNAEFSFTPTTQGSMSIVVSCLDSIPYESHIHITDEPAVVTVAATDDHARELGAEPAEFTLTRIDTATGGPGTNGDLTVHYTLSGTATEGTDYAALGTSALIPDGASNVVLTVTPLNDTEPEGTENVKLTVAGSAGNYMAGAPRAAQIDITDDDSEITIAATDAVADEGGGTATYTLTRSRGLDGTLTVNYAWQPAHSTATAADFVLNPAAGVTFADQQTTRTVTLTAVNDTLPEQAETVSVAITPDPSYHVGAASDAAVTIAYNDNTAPTAAITVPGQDVVYADHVPCRLLLEGAVSDDGNPAGTLGVAWTRVSGPDNVVFRTPTAATTAVEITAFGAYILRLSADDGWEQDSAELSVLVSTNGFDGPTGDLIVHFPFDETDGTTAYDAWTADGANNGTLVNGPVWQPAGGHDGAGAIGLDGENDQITLSDSTRINTGEFAKRTIALWFKAVDATARQVLYEEGGATRGFSMYLLDGRVFVGGWAGGENGWQTTFLSNSVTPGAWHHLALVLDATPDSTVLEPNAFRGYLDGALFADGPAAPIGSHSGNIGLGAINDNCRFHDMTAVSGYFYEGLLDEFRLYNRALSAGQIAVLVGDLPDLVPVVDAGPDMEITTALPGQLSGTVSDDGRPAGTTNVLWIQADGPGAVSFGTPDAVSSSVACGTPGTNTLLLTATDGNAKAYDELVLTVQPSEPGVAVRESEDATNLREHGGGTSDELAVWLLAEPTANVAVTVSCDGTQVLASPDSLQFSPADWYMAQTVTVTAVDDALVEGNHESELTFAAASTDPDYNGIDIAGVLAHIMDNEVNNPPACTDDEPAVAEDSGANVLDVLANDEDPDGDTLTVVSVGPAAHGVTVNHASHVSYAPAADYHGSDLFTYIVSDGAGCRATGTVNVTVMPVNDLPVAGGDAVSMPEDSPAITVDVLANDMDPDTGDTLSVLSVGAAAHGSTVNHGTHVSYAPDPDYNGSDLFTYVAADGNGGTATGTVGVTVTPVNDRPVAESRSLTTLENAPLGVVLTASDPDGDPLTFEIVAAPPNGTLLGTPPDLVYKPDTDYAGPDSFTFRAHDALTNSASATVSITVSDVFTVRINFQPAGSAVPDGFEKDDGSVFGSQGNGYSYGWATDNAGNTFERNHAAAPDQQHDTGILMNNPNTRHEPWQIACGNGDYTVRVVAGDPAAGEPVTYHVVAENSVDVANGTVTGGWVDRTNTVTVADGALSLTTGDAASSKKNALCFVEISNARNNAPVVEAGADRLSRQQSTALDGTVADDGLPNGSSLSVSWTKIDGPGNVVFANPNAEDTTATFGADGVYVLRLLATDGALQSHDELQVEVRTANEPPTCAIVSPADNAVLAEGRAIQVECDWLDPDSVVTQNLFYANGTDLIGVATGCLFSVQWTNAGLGTHALTVVCWDNGVPPCAATSAVVSVTVETDNDGDGEADSLDTDDDNDGMPDHWEDRYGLNPLAPNAGPDDDFDNDQVRDLFEYIADTNPTNPASFFRISNIANPGNATVGFMSATGRLYRVEYSDDLRLPDWNCLSNNINGTGGMLQIPDQTADGPSRCYRVQVWLAP